MSLKSIIVVAAITTGNLVHAEAFELQSGLTLKCYDDVSNQTYVIKVVDIGDEDGDVKIYQGTSTRRLLNHFKSVEIRGSGQGTLFSVWDDREGHSNYNQPIWNVVFPDDNTSDAYYFDGGDSRPIDCKIVK